jgi:hypothetical protein
VNNPFTLAERLRNHAGHNLEVHGEYIDCLDCECSIVTADPMTYELKFREHQGHECEIYSYGGPIEDCVDITVECCGDTVLVSAETDGAFQCPKCGEEFSGTNIGEYTTISDHGCCYDCHRQWQLKQ